MKFGVNPNTVPHLLEVAKKLELDVVGVSFHVGSGCLESSAFSAGVSLARTVFDMGKVAGYNFTLLDIGGGFPGQPGAKISFEAITSHLRPALDLYFPKEMGVCIIAEPGRFFVASAFTIAANITSRRVMARDSNVVGELSSDDEPMFMYYLNDGVYGSFNCLLYDHAEVTPKLYQPERYAGKPEFECSIWGPTCDALDVIKEKWMFPALEHGDWMIFEDMGAYTFAAASNFNGMPGPKLHYVICPQYWQILCNTAEIFMGTVPVRKGKKTRTLSCSMEVVTTAPSLPSPQPQELLSN
jgi:ornithine decarboxylase